jgi:carboxyl-terminal processing protease
MDEQEFKQTQGTISGKFGGLGIEITQQGGIPKVISPIDDTPAARAGLQPGDLIVSIDGRNTHGIDLGKIVDLLRGDPGTTVKLGLARGETTPIEVTITRSIIHVRSVKSTLQPDGMGYVRITQFSGDTSKDLAQAIDDLKRKSGGRLKGLVLDLRNDPGGLLSAAIGVAGAFLDGTTVVSIRSRRASENQTFTSPAKGDLISGTPIVVLINGASASASEIVAGALQDQHRATVMGTQSFGKGSVQSVIPLADRGALRLTTALYFTPAGRSIQGRGISPDVIVEAPKEQQVAGALMLRESALNGALANPGAAEQADKASDATAAPLSAPIKSDLIGTPEDAQLKAALSHLARARPARLD